MRLFAVLLCLACVAASGPNSTQAPVVDNYFGVRVADPYRWLEDGTSAAVQDWTRVQNARTRTYLDAVPGRAALSSELASLLDLGSVSVPAVAGGSLFYEVRRPGCKQVTLNVVSAGSERTLIDPAALAKLGEVVALDWWYPSTTGKYIAYGTSHNGTEQSVLHLIRVSDAATLPESIERTQAAYVAWNTNDTAFYYTRFDSGGTTSQVGRRVYFHHIGDAPDGTNDREIYGSQNKPADWPFVAGSPDGRWLIVGEPHGSGIASPITFQLRDLASPVAQAIPMSSAAEAWFNATFGAKYLFLLTNLHAPNNRVVRVDLTKPGPANWKTIIPASSDVLESVAYAGKYLALQYQRNAHSLLKISTLDGKASAGVPLPGFGSVSCCSYDPSSGLLYFGFVSFNGPKVIYRYRPDTRELSVWRSLKMPFFLSTIATEQRWFASKDGTRIPMFLVHRRDLPMHDRPVLMLGYGGFGISQEPAFSVTGTDFVLHGGIFAVPNIRGGGEFGERWHQAGMLGKKQNSFDDFEYAARWLIRAGYTSSQKLAILGSSNGGLLVTAAETQHPELFKAVVPLVPLTDMLRFQRFGYASTFVSEYGSSDDPLQFQYLLRYSPYHNIRQRTAYPATLVETSETDRRIDPLHSRKYVALLEQANTAETPVLMRVSSNTGHGFNASTDSQLAQTLDTLTFVYDQVRMPVAPIGLRHS